MSREETKLHSGKWHHRKWHVVDSCVSFPPGSPSVLTFSLSFRWQGAARKKASSGVSSSGHVGGELRGRTGEEAWGPAPRQPWRSADQLIGGLQRKQHGGGGASADSCSVSSVKAEKNIDLIYRLCTSFLLLLNNKNCLRSNWTLSNQIKRWEHLSLTIGSLDRAWSGSQRINWPLNHRELSLISEEELGGCSRDEAQSGGAFQNKSYTSKKFQTHRLTSPSLT